VTSPFLDIPASAWVAHNDLAFAVRDRYPVSPGHTLIIPRREVPTWFEATPGEHAALLALVAEVKQALDDELHPHGYNVGFNAGEVAGQTVMHLHVHVIPRYRGDVEDPRGGVRHVIPGKGNYLAAAPARADSPSASSSLSTGETTDPFLRHLEPLFARADQVAIVAAFVRERGLNLLRGYVRAALERGAHVKIITGDYLNYTEVTALRMLHAWARASGTGAGTGSLEASVVAMADLSGPMPSFHPKSWRFEAPDFAVAYVGSSNISESALKTGIEWNLRVERGRDPQAYGEVVQAFDFLWNHRARQLTEAWISDYERRIEALPAPLPLFVEDVVIVPEPHGLQRAALAALARCRTEEQRRRAIVVLATGLGKTWLAAFDAAAYARDRLGGRAPRILFIAHREELLVQASRTFRCMFRDQRPRVGFFVGEHDDLGADLVFASVQKLSRPEHRARLASARFDYAIVDEVHHGTAKSYRDVLDRLDAGFLLGLTATPDRADGADVLGLFDDYVAYRADLGVGVEQKRLVPFAYFGLKDQVDYERITWHGQRFNADELARAVDTDERLEQLWRRWIEHPGRRTIVFCCNIQHADHASAFLTRKGVKIASVHSGPTSVDRAEALTDLASGALDALCAVDLFNEGVDVPLVDRVVMLRPTESPVLFLQQLGRGLRVAPGKERLVVLDFVGNDRVFLDRVRMLLSLATEPAGLREFLEGRRDAALPGNCTIDLELEAKSLLLHFLPGGRAAVEGAYDEIVASRAERPTAGELYRMGQPPGELRAAHGSWFAFLRERDALTASERSVLDVAAEWLRELEVTPMTKCFKMVTLEALLESQALSTGLPLDELARRSHAILLRSPELFADLEGVARLPEPRQPDDRKLSAYWRDNPVKAWTNADKADKSSSTWFAVEGARFVPRLPVTAGDEETFASMTRELVDYRLAEYRARQASFEAEVVWEHGDPHLRLPSRRRFPGMPSKIVDVRLPDGALWRFHFTASLCRAVHLAGSQQNRLPDLLRRWFGLGAARGCAVRFTREPDGLHAAPVGAAVIELPSRGKILAFPRLEAAAGAPSDPTEQPPEGVLVSLPIEAPGPDLFAIRAAGDSMDGGATPIRDGDWLIMRFARGASLERLRGKVALIQVEDGSSGYGYQVKRLVQKGARWELHADNPGRESFVPGERTKPIAELVSVVRPEDLAPAPGAHLGGEEIAQAFALEGSVQSGRVGGHLFFLVQQRGSFARRDRIRWPLRDRRPGETAYVLVRVTGDGAWRYHGVARYLENEALWACASLDDPTWAALS
jgi:superfamily II DNA or RNA helicase/diadenosine tetraphosphate (Ap4A) HIT family hydrolase